MICVVNSFISKRPRIEKSNNMKENSKRIICEIYCESLLDFGHYYANLKRFNNTDGWKLDVSISDFTMYDERAG